MTPSPAPIAPKARVSTGKWLRFWAELADRDGAIRTKEGVTHYQAGAYLVFNDEAGQDGYAVTAPMFEAMYEPAE